VFGQGRRRFGNVRSGEGKKTIKEPSGQRFPRTLEIIQGGVQFSVDMTGDILGVDEGL
jgi:hypothetical protein